MEKLISTLLIVTILIPSFMMLVIPPVYSAEDNNTEEGFWLKGILLAFLSFIANRFIENPTNNSQIGKEPLIEVTNDNKPEVLGFYVNWLSEYSSSYEALKNNWRNIDMIAPFWYTLNTDGSIESRYGGHQYEATSLAQNRNIRVLPLINNNQKNNMILVDPDIRSKAINNIIELIKKNNYNGVNIDFEFIPSWTRDSYTAFIKELSRKLPEEKLLTISVFPKIDVPLNLQGAYDYKALSSYIDRMIIMTYDNHWSSGPAGPIASLKWVEENIKYALEYVSSDKILLGIANYGYDWTEKGLATDISMKKAQALAREKGVEIKWHDTHQTPYFFYQDKEGNKHEIWFENSHSTAFKLNLVKKYNLRGIAIWKLGNSSEQFWEIIHEKLR